MPPENKDKEVRTDSTDGEHGKGENSVASALPPDTSAQEGSENEVESEVSLSSIDIEAVSEEDELVELDDFELVEEVQDVHTPPPSPPVRPPPAPPSKSPRAIPGYSEEIVLQLVDPDAESVLDVLVRDHKPVGWSERATELAQELKEATSKIRIAELAYELGEIYQHHLDDQSSAVTSYGRALQADPGLRANLWAIRRVFYQRRLWPNLVKLIGAELRFATGDSQSVDLHVERGNIYLHHLEDLSAARESFEAALEKDEGNCTSLLALESIARQTGDVELLWTTIRSLADSASSIERKAALLIDLARSYRKSREKLEEAHSILLEVTQLNVLHDAVSQEREDLARVMDDSIGFVSSLERRIARLSECEEGATLGDADLRMILAMRRHQAQLLIEAQDVDGAWACLQEGLAIAPGDSLLLADLTQLAEELHRYEELAQLVAAREEGEVDSGRALELALKRAAALDKAGKEQESEELLLARSTSAPGYLPLVTARELHAAHRWDWRALAALQREMADAIMAGTSFGVAESTEPEAERAAAHYLVAGDFLRYGEGAGAEALEVYSMALAVDPKNRAAAFACGVENFAEGKFEESKSVLVSFFKTSPTDVAVLRMLVQIQCIYGDREGEIASLETLRDCNPGEEGLSLRLLDLYRQSMAYSKFADLAEVIASQSTDPETQARLYFEAGRMVQHSLKDPSRASALFLECRERWPDDRIVTESVLHSLRESGDAQGEADLLLALSESGTEDEMARYAREALTSLEFVVGDSEAAFRLAISLPQRYSYDLSLLLDVSACLLTERNRQQSLGEEGGDLGSAPLADTVEAMVALCEGDAKANMLLWLGSLHSELGRVDDARQCVQDAATLGSVSARISLLSLGILARDPQGVCSALSLLADALDAPGDRASLYEHAGFEMLAAMEDERAEEFFAQAESQVPGRVGSALGRCLLAARASDMIVHANALEHLASCCEAPYVRSSLLVRSAMIADVEGAGAIASARRREAFKISPDDAGIVYAVASSIPALDSQGSESTEIHLYAIDVCNRRAQLCSSSEAKAPWLLRQAESLERLGRLSEALPLVAEALREGTQSIRALLLMRQLCQRGGDRFQYAATSVELAQQMASSANKLHYLREAVAIFDSEFDAVPASVGTYLEILDLDGGGEEFFRLVELLRYHEDLATLYTCYSNRLTHFCKHDELQSTVPLYLERAALRELLGDISGASKDLEALFAIDASHEEALLMAENFRVQTQSGEVDHV